MTPISLAPNHALDSIRGRIAAAALAAGRDPAQVGLTAVSKQQPWAETFLLSVAYPLRLVQAAKNLNDEWIECRLADSNSSALFMLPEQQNFKYVVMPMRI